jgi:hypothetical protein
MWKKYFIYQMLISYPLSEKSINFSATCSKRDAHKNSRTEELTKWRATTEGGMPDGSAVRWQALP